MKRFLLPPGLIEIEDKLVAMEHVSFQGHEVSFLKFVVWFDMADNFVYCLLIGKSMFYLNSIQSKETIKLKATICKARRTKLTTRKIEKKATIKLCITHMIMTHTQHDGDEFIN